MERHIHIEITLCMQQCQAQSTGQRWSHPRNQKHPAVPVGQCWAVIPPCFRSLTPNSTVSHRSAQIPQIPLIWSPRSALGHPDLVPSPDALPVFSLCVQSQHPQAPAGDNKKLMLFQVLYKITVWAVAGKGKFSGVTLFGSMDIFHPPLCKKKWR